MYYAHWGLTDSPFPSRPEARAYVATPSSEEALARLDFLAQCDGQGGLVLGPRGSGKTLLLEVFARRMRKSGVVVAVVTAASAPCPLYSLGIQLGCSLPSVPPEAKLAALLVDRVRELSYEQVPVTLIADDADRLSPAVADTLAALLTTSRATLVLACRPETLSQIDPRLVERADLRIEVSVWDEADVEKFLQARLTHVGGYHQTFDRRAVGRLLEISGGIPRRVSQLAHLALLAGAGKELEAVDAETVEEAWRELSVAAS